MGAALHGRLRVMFSLCVDLPRAALARANGWSRVLAPRSDPLSWNVWNTKEDRWENLHSYSTKAAAEAFLAEVVTKDKGTYGKGPWEVRQVGDVMEQHGTKLMQLKPSMIWRCAMDDL